VTTSWSLSGDLANAWVVLATILAGISLGLLLFELLRERRSRRGALAIALTGVAALSGLLLAVLRPVRIEERGASVGARVLVLADASRSIDLRADESAQTRRMVAALALGRLRDHFTAVRMRVLTFGMGPPKPLDGADGFEVRPELGSDLTAALEALSGGTEEVPEAIVVVSDGRLDRPGAERTEDQLRDALGGLPIPVHTVPIATIDPRDASIVSVRMAGAVVAHQPASITVEIACTGGLGCGEIPITARELHLDAPAQQRASGAARVQNGRATLDLEVTLDRAGQRILEVSIESPDGDTIPENDRRYITVEVARDRVRLLHVAGRPTYDVRALRHWLKSDASVDVVAFFILRTQSDDVVASQEELALIPFPVDELFTKHLPSFDAVILQDFDAQPYGLSAHLGKLAAYVRQGGGLIMVGGPNAFVQGNYARTPLAGVLPVSLDGIDAEEGVDFASFVPQLTKAGAHAPVLEPIHALLGERLPEMPGTNIVGEAREDATVLLEHPSLKTKGGGAMPVLALGEYGSGRSIALTVDGSHELLFSRFALEAAGRAHGAFWDAMLGWLMRDPRFEPAKVELPSGCVAGVDSSIALYAAFVDEGTRADVEIQRMGDGEVVKQTEVTLPGGGQPVSVDIGKLEAGGYTASVRLARQGPSTPSRYDFACEAGGEEWADPRPDAERLARIAKATSGLSVPPDRIDELPRPEAAQVVAERRIHPVLPAWAWCLVAAALCGTHWIVRRRVGLS
jgi:uncharacterized membrane protein